MSRITHYILEPNVVYTNGAFLIKVKVQDSYKYKKYLVSEDIKYTTVNGTTFTLTNVKDGQPGSILQLQGNTTQNGTPTPTSPIEVSTVSGDNEVVVCGKNLFDKSKAQIGKAWNNSSNTARAILITKVEPNTSYTISYQSLNGVELYWFGRANENDSTRTTDVISITSSPKTITTNATTNYLGLQFNKTSIAQSDIDNCNLQIEKGSQATTYEPYVGNSYRVDFGVENLIQNNMTSQTLNGVTFTINEDKSIKVVGTATARTEPNLWTSANWTMKANTKYYNNSNTTIYLYGNYNGTNGYFIFNSGATYNREYDYIVNRVYIRVENGATVDTTYYPQISLKKSTAYTPYGTTPIELCKIGNYVDKLKRAEGKNLFNLETAYHGTINASGVVGGNEAFRTTTYIATTPNTSYYFSTTQKSGKTGSQIYIAYYDNTETFISRDSYNSLEHKFTTPTNCYYMRAGVYTESQENIMLEYGENKTSYEPYGNNWYIEKKVGKIELDGSSDEAWRLNSSGTYTKYQWSAALPDKYNVINSPILCSHFKQITVSQGDARNIIGIANGVYNGYSLQIVCDITTLADFIAWLSTNKPIVYYQLANPTYETITNENLIQQLNNIQDMQLIENLCYVDWVGEEKPTMYLQYGTTDILHAYIITENNKRIRTDWGI